MSLSDTGIPALAGERDDVDVGQRVGRAAVTAPTAGRDDEGREGDPHRRSSDVHGADSATSTVMVVDSAFSKSSVSSISSPTSSGSAMSISMM